MHAHLRTLIETGTSAERARDRRGRDTARLDVGGDADAAQLAVFGRLLPALLEAGVVRRLERHLERREIVAAVVLQSDWRLVGVGVLRHEIAPAQLRRIELHLVRGGLDDALDHIGRLRSASAAGSPAQKWRGSRPYWRPSTP